MRVNNNDKYFFTSLKSILVVLMLVIFSISCIASTSSNMSIGVFAVSDEKSDAEILESLEQQRQHIQSTKKVFAYMPSWGVYGGHEYFDVKSIDYSGVTHVTYSFAKPIDADIEWDGDTNHQDMDNITSNTKHAGVRFDDPDAALSEGSWMGGDGNIVAQVRGEINKYQDKYFVFSVGGWSYSEKEEFENATNTKDKLYEFAQSLVNFMYNYGFDGIDIDWEFPLTQAGQEQFLELHKVVREMLTTLSMTTEKYYQLSTATTPNLENIQYISPSEIAQYVDTVNFMAYDYNGGSFATSSKTSHNAPLYESTLSYTESDFNVNAVAQAYLDQGVPANQLLVGLPLYSRSWINVEAGSDPNHPGLGQTGYKPEEASISEGGATGGKWGNGSNPYYEIENLLAGNDGYQRYWDEQAQVPYIYSSKTKVYHSYDDEQSISTKLEYINNNGFAGAILWDLTGDTRVGAGFGTSGAYKIGNLIKNALIDVKNESTDNARITTTDLPQATVDEPYSTQLSATGTGPYQYRIDTAKSYPSHPNWISISSNGILSGTPREGDEIGELRITVVVTGSTGVESEKPFGIEVVGDENARIVRSDLPDAVVGEEYSDLEGTQILATGRGITYSLASNPSWLKIDSTGQLSGVPSEANDSISFSVVVQASNGSSSSEIFSIKVESVATVVPPNDTNNSNGGSNTGLIIALVAIAGVLFLGIIVFIIINTKKGKSKATPITNYYNGSNYGHNNYSDRTPGNYNNPYRGQNRHNNMPHSPNMPNNQNMYPPHNNMRPNQNMYPPYNNMRPPSNQNMYPPYTSDTSRQNNQEHRLPYNRNPKTLSNDSDTDDNQYNKK